MQNIKLKPSKHHHILYIVPIILSFLVLFGSNGNTSALSYSFNTNVQFTFNPTISVGLSGDLIIGNLAPGSYSDSNVVTITAGSNALSGYTLYATVGNDTDENPSHDNTNLTHTNGTNTFSSISTNKTNLSDFDASTNTWGYSYSIDSGTTWINGDYDAVSPSNGYNGLPLYTNTGIKLAETNNQAGESTIKFKIGARANNTQVSGVYTNTINFYAIPKPSPVSFYDAYAAAGKEMYKGYYKMQDMTNTICSTVELYGDESVIDLIDIRDNETYKIAKLKDDNCWMLDNLNLDLTNSNVIDNLTISNTNADEPSLISLKSGNRSAGDQYATAGLSGTNWISDRSLSAPMVNTSGTFEEVLYTKDSIVTSYGVGGGKRGVYYNYCAASAGSYCYGNDATSTGIPASDPNPDSLIDIDSDICPKNWRMPTGSSSGEYETILSTYDYNVTAADSSSLQYGISVSLSGYIDNNVAQSSLNIRSIWWSSTYSGASTMYRVSMESSKVVTQGNNSRIDGFSVRCLAR